MKKLFITIAAAGLMLAIINHLPVSADTLDIAVSAQKFSVGGVCADVEAYNINGSNFIRAAGLAEILDVDIAFDPVTNTVFFDKSLPFAGVRRFEPPFSRGPLPDDIIEFITGRSYKKETPFGYQELEYLVVSHVNFDGEHRAGEMIVSAGVGAEVLEIFAELYEKKFPIDKIGLIDHYGASDEASMADNNTSAFNYKTINNSAIVSKHGYGLAIDINPVQNPYVSGGTVLPAPGSDYLDRADIRRGMIVKGDDCYNAFISRGWIWGGDWDSPKDYQHFEKNFDAPYAGRLGNAAVPEDASQLMIVASDGSNAAFFFLEKNTAGAWVEDISMRAVGFVGESGAGLAREGLDATPAGIFKIAEAFGAGGLETGLDSFAITENTYWVDDPNSKYYNRRAEGLSGADWSSAERMAASPSAYACGFVIGYNAERTPGAGSAIFFHIGDKPTGGCVAASEETCRKYLKKLDKNKNPYIFIY